MATKKPQNILVPRITQLDAVEFDNEIINVLRGSATEAAKFLKPGTIQPVDTELDLLLNLLVFKFIIQRNNATVGQQLLGVRYRSKFDRETSFLYGFMNYGLPYLVAKFKQFTSTNRLENYQELMRRLELFVKISSIINFVFFLRQGKFPTLVDRILNLRYHTDSNPNRNIGYQYMTRELLWHGFTELLVVTLPLINYRLWRRKITNLFMWKKDGEKALQRIELNVNTICVVCKDAPILPCAISEYCKHVACYYCLKGNIMADERFMCPECGEENTVTEQVQFIINS